MADKEAKKEALLQFAGNNSEEGRQAVMIQRDLKNKNKALLKSQKKLKGLKEGDAGYAEAAAEVDELNRAIAELEGKLASAAGKAAAAKDSASSSSAPAASTASAATSHTMNNSIGEEKKNKPEGKSQKSAVQNEGPEDYEAAEATLMAALEAEVRLLNGHEVRASPSPADAADTTIPPESSSSSSPSPPFHNTRSFSPCQVAGAGLLHFPPSPLDPSGYSSLIHPQVVEATVLMEEMVIVGCNARTMAMISAFKKLLKSLLTCYRTLSTADFTEIERAINANYSFMSRVREATAGMRYAKETFLRRAAALCSSSVELSSASRSEAMLHILDSIESEIQMSLTSIVEERSAAYISPSDTILVFGRSSVVENILLHASKTIQFRVIVIDSAPLFEGRELTQRLSAAGVSVTYGVLTACCTLLPKATRVFIGASSVLQNGDVFSRCGTAIVAACAKSFRRPVLCFSESYKFIPEVWLGNIGQNHAAVGGGAALFASHAGGGRSLYRSDSVDGWGGRGGGAAGFPTSSSSLNASSNNNINTNNLTINVNNNNNMNNNNTTRRMAPCSATHRCGAVTRGYLYDLTPAAYVDMIICEMGCLHTSAIVAAIKDRETRDGFL